MPRFITNLGLSTSYFARTENLRVLWGKKYYRSVRVTYKLNKIKLKGISDKVNQRVEVDIDNKNQGAKEKWERQFGIFGKDVQIEN